MISQAGRPGSSTHRKLWGFVLVWMMWVGVAHGEEISTLSRYEYATMLMGTRWHMVVYAPDEATAITASQACWKRIKQIEQVFSDYEPDSEVSRLCRNYEPGELREISEDLAKVLKTSIAISRTTDGAFDVTVGRLVRLWRIARRTKSLPSSDELEAALKTVGSDHLSLDECAKTLSFKRPETKLDFGGIAKGYAADEGLKILERHGIHRALIEGGGDITVGDPPPGKQGWRIQIEAASDDAEANTKTLLVANQGIATSGDLYRFTEIDGVRYSHIIDPRTGMGLTTRRLVTVIAPTGMQADAWASAISVMGPDKGLPLIEKQKQFEAQVIERSGEESVTRTTPNFDAH